MKLKMPELAGTGKVFRFSFRQVLISKSSIAMMVIMFLSSAGALALSALNANSGVLRESAARTLYVLNETKYKIGAEDIAEANEVFRGLDVVFTEEGLDKVRAKLDAGEIYSAAALISGGLEEGAYSISLYSGKDSEIGALELSTLSSAVKAAFSEARLKAADATEEQMKTAVSPYGVELESMDEYLSDEKDFSFSASFTISFVYTFLLLMLIMYSTVFIIRSIIDEKTSSLVDTLMISVRPLALIVGKILAAMCVMLINLAVLAAGMAATLAVMSALSGNAFNAEGAFEAMGLGGALGSLGWRTIAAMLVSVLLGYASFSVVGGLSGASCSSAEDAGAANLATMLLCYFGYFGSLATMGVHGRTASAVISLVPFLSVFTAPVRYAMGQISFGVLCAAWMLQAAIAALLFVFAARVYQSLLMYKGNKIKLRQLLAMARAPKGDMKT